MLLAIDQGNSHTVLGLFEGDRLRAHWRVATRSDRTADELGVELRALCAGEGIAVDGLEGIMISSVVPDLDAELSVTCSRYFGADPLFVGPGTRTGMPIIVDNPHEVGADRIVNAVAAVERWGSPVVVLDFGTATTLDVVNARGEYLGGIIAPGVAISAEALFHRAARLARVNIKRPSRVIGRNTAESIQSGLYHGYSSLVEGIVRRALEELGRDAPVVATGGLANVFREELGFLAAIDPDLTLTGLRILWERNRR
jgi:type III pantothenate kinase